MRRLFVSAFLECDTDDHFAAALPGRDCVKNSFPAVKHADTGRSTHLVTGESEEIAAELLNIERHVPDALRCINQSDRANVSSFLAKIGHGINRAERIGNVSEAEHFYFRRQQ